MPKPSPVLHTPTLELRQRAIDRIYKEGWSVGCLGYHAATMTGHYLDPHLINLCPYLVLIKGSFYLGSDYIRGDSILVNSINHLVSYCKTLGDRAPKRRE